MTSVKDKRGILILTLLIVFTLIWIQVSDIPLLSNARQDLESLVNRHRVVINDGEWTKEKSDIVIVDIDRASIDRHGAWPWHRSKMAHLVNRIINEGAAIIVFDVVFSEASHNSAKDILAKYVYEKEVNPVVEQFLEEIKVYFDHDTAFANRIQHQEVILGFEFHNRKTGSKGVINSPILSKNRIPYRSLTKASNFYGNVKVIQQASKYSGFINLTTDNDGVLRKTPLIMRYGNQLYASLSLQAARIRLLNKKISFVSKNNDSEHLLAIKMDESIVPTDKRGYIDVTYRGKANSYKILSANDILKRNKNTAMFDRKIVIIGSSVPYIRPLKNTLAGKGFTSAEVHANIIDSIINQRLLLRPEGIRLLDVLLLIAMGLALSLTMPFLRNRTLLLLFAGLSAFWIIYNTWMYHQFLVITAVSVPLLMLILITGINFLVRMEPATRLGKRMLSSVRSKIAVRQTQDSESGTASTTEDHATIMLINIRDFSTISESLNAPQLNRLMNLFCNPVSTIILRNGGQLNQAVGPAVMAIWHGINPDHGNQALRACMEILAKMKELNPVLQKKNLPPIILDIAINTGPVKVRRFDYQSNLMFGETIQTCNSLVELNAFYNVRCLVSDSTASAADSFVFHPVDTLKITPNTFSTIYSPMGKLESLSVLEFHEYRLFQEITQLLDKGDLSQARLNLRELVKLVPNVKVYQMYLERLNQLFRENDNPTWTEPLNRRSVGS